MVSEEDKRDIAQAYLERGIEQGLEQGIAQGLGHGLEQGIAQGLEQGLEQGKVEERLETARRMLSLGCEPEIIAQATTFSLEEIKSLI